MLISSSCFIIGFQARAVTTFKCGTRIK